MLNINESNLNYKYRRYILSQQRKVNCSQIILGIKENTED